MKFKRGGRAPRGSAVVPGQHQGAQSPKTDSHLLYAIILQVSEYACARGCIQSSERTAIADHGQPLNRAKEHAQLAFQRFRAVAQQRFDYPKQVLPAVRVEFTRFRNDGRNHGSEDGWGGIERHSTPRYHGWHGMFARLIPLLASAGRASG